MRKITWDSKTSGKQTKYSYNQSTHFPPRENEPLKIDIVRENIAIHF